MIDPRSSSATEISENIGDVLAAIRRLIAEDETQGQAASSGEALPFQSSMPRSAMPSKMGSAADETVRASLAEGATVAKPEVAKAVTAKAEEGGGTHTAQNADAPQASRFGAVPRIPPRFSGTGITASKPDWGRKGVQSKAPLVLENASDDTGPETAEAGLNFMTSTVRRSAMSNPWAESDASTDENAKDALASDGFSTPMDMSGNATNAADPVKAKEAIAKAQSVPAPKAASETVAAEPTTSTAAKPADVEEILMSVGHSTENTVTADQPNETAQPEAAKAAPKASATVKRLPHTGSMLRDLIREIIQDELRGDLGEVIAHEVERAVRVQMMRARQLRQDRLPVAS